METMEMLVTKRGQRKMPHPAIICSLGGFEMPAGLDDLISNVTRSVFSCPFPGEDRAAQAIRAEAGVVAAVLAAARPTLPPA